MNELVIAAIAAALGSLGTKMIDLLLNYSKQQKLMKREDTDYIIELHRKHAEAVQRDNEQLRRLVSELQNQLNYARTQVTLPDEKDLREAKEKIENIKKSLAPKDN